jgi:type II secretory pathway pseudopilin PulG
VPDQLGNIDTGKERFALQQLQKISATIRHYNVEKKRYPSSLKELNIDPDDQFDPWNSRIQFSYNKTDFILSSYGADRLPDSKTFSQWSHGKDIIVQNGELLAGPETLILWVEYKRK